VENSAPGRIRFAEISAAWKSAMATPRLRAFALGAGPALVGVLLVLRRFLDFIEARRGAALNDPVLALFAPHDIALVLFPLMYLTMIGLLVALIRHPKELVAGIWAYVLMIVVRMLVMYLLPLEPPSSMVALRDPFVELFGEQRTLTRDLFFSGHTATLFLFALVVPTPRLRALAFTMAGLIASGVLLQHAHYTVDVVVAPFVSYACYRAARALVTGHA